MTEKREIETEKKGDNPEKGLKMKERSEKRGSAGKWREKKKPGIIQ